MTRAVIAAVKFDLSGAFAYHPMFWSMPVLYLYFLFDRGLFKKKIYNVILLGSIALGFLVNWVSNIISQGINM